MLSRKLQGANKLSFVIVMAWVIAECATRAPFGDSILNFGLTLFVESEKKHWRIKWMSFLCGLQLVVLKIIESSVEQWQFVFSAVFKRHKQAEVWVLDNLVRFHFHRVHRSSRGRDFQARFSLSVETGKPWDHISSPTTIGIRRFLLACKSACKIRRSGMMPVATVQKSKFRSLHYYCMQSR